MDYGFTHDGQVFTPNGTSVDVAANDARNAEIEHMELARWDHQPARHLAYYTEHGTVTTWRGTVLGTITGRRIYRHNFGGRFIVLSVLGTNGVRYYGRASYDNGNCIHLRKGA
jgi:hypothetical protein